MQNIASNNRFILHLFPERTTAEPESNAGMEKF
jgi:hypothetical protein